MSKYQPGEARAWAREQLSGCCGCVMPSFTDDLSDLNEAAIRHDVALEKQLGMSSVLIVSECGTTEEEFARFVEIVVDEAGSDLATVVQLAQPTLDRTRAAATMAYSAGVDLALLCYPQFFYPRSEDDVFAFTKTVADETPLGIMIFAMNLWNFGRLHPAGFSMDLLRRFVTEIPNVAAIKNEIGIPGAGGISHVFESFRDEVLVTDPMETNMPAWVKQYGQRFMGTSNYEYYADQTPRILKLLQNADTYEEGMAAWWKLHPARLANAAVTAEISAGTSTVHRLVWKYQGWLMGFNGGPVRPPTPRINDAQMTRLRSAALASGLPVTDDEDHLFFRGRVAAG
ncbi:dihydrodipicolinate synthase family protein [Microtetraspora malaysiensis]|uniref:dihydrodipicolinate synthase family protein n=1 Tax=Microtetraspora malaysiensis TaxID=161358 RepID=UPI003D932E45